MNLSFHTIPFGLSSIPLRFVHTTLHVLYVKRCRFRVSPMLRLLEYAKSSISHRQLTAYDDCLNVTRISSSFDVSS